MQSSEAQEDVSGMSRNTKFVTSIMTLLAQADMTKTSRFRMSHPTHSTLTINHRLPTSHLLTPSTASLDELNLPPICTHTNAAGRTRFDTSTSTTSRSTFRQNAQTETETDHDESTDRFHTGCTGCFTCCTG
jgi:hypothetical protein